MICWNCVVAVVLVRHPQHGQEILIVLGGHAVTSGGVGVVVVALGGSNRGKKRSEEGFHLILWLFGNYVVIFCYIPASIKTKPLAKPM